MRSLLIAFYIISFSLVANAQKVVNDANAEPRAVNSFHAIHISNAFEVILSSPFKNLFSLLIRLNPVYNVLYVGIEILYANAQSVEPDCS